MKDLVAVAEKIAAVLTARRETIVIAESSTEKEEIIGVEIDLARVEETRQHWPFLRDRRIDAYKGLDQRFID